MLSNVLPHYFDIFHIFLRRAGGNTGNYKVYYSSSVGDPRVRRTALL